MPVWQAVMTVAATLAGTVSGTVLGSVLKGKADKAARVHEWQVEVVKIFGDLMHALEAHYVAMWDLEAARVRGGQDEIDAALAASLTTRNAITRPRSQFAVLVPRLGSEVARAVGAVFAMDTAVDESGRSAERLAARRLEARAALDDLVTVMTALMARLGAGLPGESRPARRRRFQRGRGAVGSG
ncbi:hypothetical protein BS329_38855 [Amycolatopsis coloradensis]|uniref:Uncharacterized protein n=1 Tax=Amycolatopsis coloradensis TaxID=76021 RepID=A0A1R0KES7_9PSEU|nr:hypothetical protein [Amycolatopsis coloradensis]OLZ43620.1 hypothetical protein BS329_38855 [Amycolatopsis coloradensis]